MNLPETVSEALSKYPRKQVLFLDEAGTDAEAPVAVVAGVLVDPDSDPYRRTEAMAHSLIERLVPAPYQEGFISHGKKLFQSDRWPGWELKDRISFIQTLMSLPKLLGLGIFTAAVRPNDYFTAAPGLRDENIRHAAAFGICVASADQVIRMFGSADIVGFTIAENVPEMEAHLKSVFRKLRAEPLFLKETVVNLQGNGPPLDLRIERMQLDPHFMPKGPIMLQIADAIAYGVRRAYAGLSGGLDYHRAAFGQEYAGGTSPLSRCTMLPKATGRWRVLSDPNGLLEKTFGLKAGQSAPYYGGPHVGQVFAEASAAPGPRSTQAQDSESPDIKAGSEDSRKSGQRS